MSWSGPNNDIPTPKKGYISDYDRAKEESRKVQKELDVYLKEVRKRLGGNS